MGDLYRKFSVAIGMHGSWNKEQVHFCNLPSYSARKIQRRNALSSIFIPFVQAEDRSSRCIRNTIYIFISCNNCIKCPCKRVFGETFSRTNLLQLKKRNLIILYNIYLFNNKFVNYMPKFCILFWRNFMELSIIFELSKN